MQGELGPLMKSCCLDLLNIALQGNTPPGLEYIHCITFVAMLIGAEQALMRSCFEIVEPVCYLSLTYLADVHKTNSVHVKL